MAGADIRGFLHRGLQVIVSPEVGNPTESPRLPLQLVSAGRLPVNAEVDRAVDHPRHQKRPTHGDNRPVAAQPRSLELMEQLP